ncbi:Hypothetical predicted protein [Paramuricea clavata]|uniref:Uncharacterized protein n=2 Tax=Paramuricea clavata TaxID=317549 RepID=A0A6S7JY42_PARCT|nr:Hypothetical predicted protein [Paramuricea clavata]
MRIYFVLCFAAFVAFTQTQLGLAGPPGPPGKRGPTGSKRVRITPYCRVSSKITNFLKQFRSTGLKGASGKKGSAGLRFKSKQSRFANYKWIYNCLHVAFNFQHRIFEKSTYQCCQQCEFPGFSRCMRKYSGAVAQARCNGEAIRCIARCINKKSPTAGRPGPTGGRPGPPGPGAKKCPVKRKKVGGSYCLERSCIRV